MCNAKENTGKIMCNAKKNTGKMMCNAKEKHRKKSICKPYTT